MIDLKGLQKIARAISKRFGINYSAVLALLIIETAEYRETVKQPINKRYR